MWNDKSYEKLGIILVITLKIYLNSYNMIGWRFKISSVHAHAMWNYILMRAYVVF